MCIHSHMSVGHLYSLVLKIADNCWLLTSFLIVYAISIAQLQYLFSLYNEREKFIKSYSSPTFYCWLVSHRLHWKRYGWVSLHISCIWTSHSQWLCLPWPCNCDISSYIFLFTWLGISFFTFVNSSICTGSIYVAFQTM